jgi:VanZ family protein
MTWLWRWAPVAAQMAAIFAISSMTAVPDMPGGLNNYTGHAIGYGLLGALAFRAFAGATWAGLTRGAGLRAIALSSAYGVTDEWHQSFVPNRTTDLHDWVADTVGALIGVLIVLLLARLAGRRGPRTRGV